MAQHIAPHAGPPSAPFKLPAALGWLVGWFVGGVGAINGPRRALDGRVLLSARKWSAESPLHLCCGMLPSKLWGPPHPPTPPPHPTAPPTPTPLPTHPCFPTLQAPESEEVEHAATSRRRLSGSGTHDHLGTPAFLKAVADMGPEALAPPLRSLQPSPRAA